MTELTIWTADFWKATGERAIRTAAGALLALVAVAGFSPRTADWADIFITVGLATCISVLMAITSNGISRTGPALTDSEKVMPPEPQPKDPPEYVPERARNDDE
jgi:protein involved in polysaccharide export with SLBB domain